MQELRANVAAVNGCPLKRGANSELQAPKKRIDYMRKALNLSRRQSFGLNVCPETSVDGLYDAGNLARGGRTAVTLIGLVRPSPSTTSLPGRPSLGLY